MVKENTDEKAKTANKDGSLLHSGEHLFARALQNEGLDIHVRKADTFRGDGRGFLVIREKIPIEKLFIAERRVNEVIPMDLKTETKTFDDINAAKLKYKDIRFNEERLEDTKQVRVVRIGDFDVSACKNVHVGGTAEITAFAIVSISYLKGETTVEFKAGRDAVFYLISRNDSVVSLGKEYNFIPSEIDKVFKDVSSSSTYWNDSSEVLFIKLIEQAGRDVVYTGRIDLSKFYGVIHDYIKNNPIRCLILLSETQLLAIRGKNNTFILQDIGMQLQDKKIFAGKISDDYLNGKITDYNKIVDILSGLPDKLG
jgi:alanyl-tRNA synthetase